MNCNKHTQTHVHFKLRPVKLGAKQAGFGAKLEKSIIREPEEK